MEEKKEKQIEEKATTEVVAKKRSSRRRTVSKTLEAARRLKGSLIVNDPKFLQERIISGSLHVRVAYNFVIYTLAWGYCLLFS